MTDSPARARGNNVFLALLDFFRQFGADFARGDIFVKLSLLVMGAGCFRRGQIIKGLLITLFQAVIIIFTISFALPYLADFSTLGTVTRAMVYNPDTMKNEVNDYDHSFKILLYSVVSLIVLFCALVVWLRNLRSARALEVTARQGKRVPSFIEEVKSYRNERFHITLLSLPCLGVVVFTVVPLIIMIAVAFTNYDQQHMPPGALFTWVGLANFKALFSNSITLSFGYAFFKVLRWTLIWAFAATFTCYIGGILLSIFINNAKTKCKQLWRTLFVISIAVPQFVTLLVVRNFFRNQGIVNTYMSQWGITAFLQKIGLVSESLTFIPFLTNPAWAMVMIILINIWIGVPYLMLIATGILMNIPKELYESARIDGASPFKTFIHVTMPYMLFVTAPYLVTSVVSNINNFNVIFLLTQDVYITTDQKLANANAKEIDLLVTWLYRLTQEYYNYKMASVIGIMVFVVCAVFTLLAFNIVLKRNKEDKFQL
ncbi:MAG: sugar ABC transporter permease [Oscillospiraceae bacterium]|jgi:arabinogalactan oligomer/maltooligosaccharide transport system permease protein|nr:sugar ABC transporter permease [Oscillospiraceae bacterium]